MAIVRCSNKTFNDSRCNVPFKDGEARTDNAAAIAWFKAHGYEVLEEKASKARKGQKDA